MFDLYVRILLLEELDVAETKVVTFFGGCRSVSGFDKSWLSTLTLLPFCETDLRIKNLSIFDLNWQCMYQKYKNNLFDFVRLLKWWLLINRQYFSPSFSNIKVVLQCISGF